MDYVRNLLKIGLISAFLVPATTLAHPASANLHQIERRIQHMQHTLAQHQAQQQQQQHNLEQLETKAGQVALQLHHTNQQAHQLHLQITKLNAQAVEYHKKIQSQRLQLSDNLKAIYILSNHSTLEQLLRQNNISHIERNITYYQYLNKNHLQAVTTLQQTLTLANETLAQLKKSYQSLASLRNQEHQELASIKTISKKRNILIKKIKNNIDNESLRLETLLQDKQRLESELRSLSANPLLYQAIGKPFSQLKHHLSWPTKGKLVAKYGTKFDKSQLRWKGVLFLAPQDQPVYAVADGKVIFARWLQGYGLLMIIYHGQGYMTLYGHNHYLYKKTGDIVHAGDQIAAVGDTGGYEATSLYFAIRHNTLPSNPLSWFKHR